MREKSKNLIRNIIIGFAICVLFLFLFLSYQSYTYYSVYDREELSVFFSMSQTVLNNFRIAFGWAIYQMFIYVPILMLLEKTKMKNFVKIIITLILTFVISFIFVLFNL